MTDLQTVIVTDRGFAADDWTAGFCGPGAANDCAGIDLPSDTDPAGLEIGPGVRMIRVDFLDFADGRGFTIARALRLRGYTGRLRARGHVIADQYAMARRAGFDEVEIDASLAARQPWPQWQARSDWRAHDHQARLRG